MTTVPDVRWRKSTRSTNTDSCIELANTGNAVRDSKNPGGPTLGVDFGALLDAAKAGRLHR